MTEVPSNPVRLTSPERALTYTPLLGLQGRLLMGGEALFPNRTVELHAEGINISKENNVDTLINKASIRERGTYWGSQPETTKEAQLSAWKKNVATKISSLSSSSFGQEHAEFFENIGIDTAHFSETNAQSLYSKYFLGENGKESIDLFMEDAIKTFEKYEPGDRLAAAKKHLAAIEWMAGMFGKNSSELVTQMLDAMLDNGGDPAAFVAKRKDKVNVLSSHEKELLTFLTEGETAPIEAPPRPIPIVKWGETPEEIEEDLDPEITILEPEEAGDIVDFVIKSDELTKNGPTVNITEQMNRTAATKFIATLDTMFDEAKKNPARRTNEKRDPSPTGIIVENELGIRRTDNPGRLRDKYYDMLSVIETARTRYHLPLIFLNHGGHANLALKILKNPETDGWSAIIYDPFHAGEEVQGEDANHIFSTKPGPIKVIDIPADLNDSISVADDTEKSPILQLINESRNGVNTGLFMSTGIYDNPLWRDFVANGGYDLTLLGDAELTNDAIRAKVQAFQTGETYNCVVYSLWSAFIRTAAKYTPENCPPAYRRFFTEGIAKLKEDFDIDILTRDKLPFTRKN